MMFEMMTGRRPFPSTDPIALATSVLRLDAPRLSSTGLSVPPALEKLVASLLERDPAHRPQTGAEVQVALGPLRDDQSAPLSRRTLSLLRKLLPGNSGDR